MSSHRSAGNAVPGHGYNVSDSADALWTPERCLQVYQTANDQYWADHGLTMNHSGAPGYPAQGTMPSAGQSHCASTAAYYPSLSSPQSYRILPQQEYIATRRYQPQAPIVFRASPSMDYVRLVDFYPSYTATRTPSLEGDDDSVFSEENLSQKQSIRLQARPFAFWFLKTCLAEITIDQRVQTLREADQRQEPFKQLEVDNEEEAGRESCQRDP